MPRHLHSRALRGATGIALALAAAACRSVPISLADHAPAPTSVADGLFGGIAARFTLPQRDDDVRLARRLITLAMLTPSRVFRGTAAWHAPASPSVRTAAWHGRTTAGHYRFSADDAGAPPRLPGDGRHALRLRHIGEDEYEWLTTTDFGIGNVPPAAIGALPIAWFASGERALPSETHAELRAAFPRSAREWGRLFTIESLAAVPLPDSSWRQRIVVSLHPDRAARSYPAFGAWLAKYVSPMRVRLRLRDGEQTWFEFGFASDTLTVTLRSRDGRLLPLEGGFAPMPDTLTLDVDASARFRIFRIGFRALHGRFVTVRNSTERGWSVRFDREPDWQLPLLTEQMLRGPLRRPFRDGGVSFSIVARSDPAIPQTVLARRLHATVQESTILRFLSRLVNTGIGDYVEGADRETNVWLAAAFGALSADARAIVEPPQTQTPPR